MSNETQTVHPWGVITTSDYPDCGEVDYVVIGESEDGTFADPVAVTFGATATEAQARAVRIIEADAMRDDLLAALERCEQEARDEGREWFWLAAIIHRARGEEQ